VRKCSRLPPLRAAPRGARFSRHEHSRIAARREHSVGGDRAAAAASAHLEVTTIDREDARVGASEEPVKEREAALEK